MSALSLRRVRWVIVVAMELNVALSATKVSGAMCDVAEDMARCGELGERQGNTGFTNPDLFSRVLAAMVARYE
jgi:hypothetical protein